MNTINEIIHEIDEGTLPDTSRRKALVVATGVMGGIGLLATAAPFVASLQPSERALPLAGQCGPMSRLWRQASCRP